MEESYGGASGEYPEYGAIFMSNSSTRKECLRRELFGLPMGQAKFVKQVKTGMMLFLFEFESRELHGVFRACSDGAMNIEPDAFRSSGKQFPAQVKFTQIWRCRPLRESEFRHAIEENYFTAKKFKFGLSETQVARLLKLFSLKREVRSQPRKTSVRKSTRTIERNLRNAAGDHGIRNADGDAACKFPFGVASAAGDRGGYRLIENPGDGNESDSGLEYDPTNGNEYPGDSSGVCRRLVDPKCHGSNDRVGYDVNMNNRFCPDALTNNSLVNDRRSPKNVRHTASGGMENVYQQKGGTAQAMRNFEEESMVPAQSSVPPNLPYGTNTEYYDPDEPGIMGDATMKRPRHDPGDPNVDLIGSASYAPNSTYGLEEEIIPVGGGYVIEDLPSETAEPFPDEHTGTSMNTSSVDLDYYIPMPIEYREYQTNTGMFGVARAESESRNGHSQFPDLLTSAGDTENMSGFEKPPYSNHSIFPSFPYHLISRNLSPKDGLNNEFATHQHEEEFGGHVSYTSDMVIRDSSIYPSFTYTSNSRDGADLYPENRTNNEVQAYQRHEEFGGDVFNSNNRVTQVKDRISPADFERKRTRESVFKRLGGPSNERDAEKDTSPDTDSVDEVMAFLNDCHKSWMEEERQNMSNSEDFGKPKKKKEKIRTAEVLDNDLMLPFTETTPDDLLDCEESVEHSVQKQPFIDFKRRSRAQKSLGNPAQGCQDSPKHSSSQNKRRKLLRPKLIEDDLEKDRGNKDDLSEIVLASVKDGENNDDPTEQFLASQSVTKVPVPDFFARTEVDSEKDRSNNDDPIVQCSAPQSTSEVPVQEFLRHIEVNDDDSEKDRGNNDDSIVQCSASQSATEVPIHGFLGRNENDTEKDIGNNEDPTVKFLASQSTKLPVHDFLGVKKDGSEKDRRNTDDPIENYLSLQSATEVLVCDFLGCNEDDSEKDRGTSDDPVEKVLATQSATEVLVHDFLGHNEVDSEKGKGNNEDLTVKFMASQSATEVPVHDFLGLKKNRGNSDDPTVQFLASQLATEVPVHGFFGRNEDGSENERGINYDPTVKYLDSHSATRVPVHDLLGLKEDNSEKDRGNIECPIQTVLASKSATEVSFHDFLGCADR